MTSAKSRKAMPKAAPYCNLSRLLPPSFLQALRGESPAGLAHTKDFIIDQINQDVDLMGLNESQERDLIALLTRLLEFPRCNAADRAQSIPIASICGRAFKTQAFAVASRKSLASHVAGTLQGTRFNRNVLGAK